VPSESEFYFLSVARRVKLPTPEFRASLENLASRPAKQKSGCFVVFVAFFDPNRPHITASIRK
jgi:hypothetical protein